ncbi:class I SAM-dependent methyltransferase [Kitasatospora paracochleata]|uniref:SAM-dependent methyltransferase n=1 Tax=Kitasatospora paracochleata TaxID=58354 RepID=A0ABT1IV20_9ACTN|nr:class I SAM-dependent methyltransferase [Kitasatospora paracochleata]MCP2308994.1 SAM-dependent methyltransferase [Kitasatospora paracochleata]
MPTLPPEGTSPSPRASRQLRELAESFGIDPERYDRARPDYPRALIEAVTAAAPGPDLLDVGIGTGIAARQFEAAGCRVLGVEIDPRMAAWARQRGHRVEVAPFEDWDPAGRTFDAVVSAQTWHWVDPAAGAAKAAEVLRPGGRLTVFWNVDQPPPELAAAFAEVYREVLPDSLGARRWQATSGGYEALAERAAEGIRATGGFDEPELSRYAWERDYTREEWLDQLPTTGAHTRLPAEVLARVLAAVGASLDAAGGGFRMRYTTLAVTAARTAGP